jgi:bacterioferritin-associated ferredoxin
LTQCLGVGSVCGKCSPYVKNLIDENRTHYSIMTAAA